MRKHLDIFRVLYFSNGLCIMNVSSVSEIKSSSSICSIDCCGQYLALSLASDIVTVYVLKDFYVNCACSPLISFPDIVRFFNFPYLLCGTGDGDLLILEMVLDTASIQIQSSQKVHTSTIKEIISSENKIYTCGLDNYVNIFQVSKGLKTPNLLQTHSFIAHDGWVVGMSISSQYLLTQGSDNKIIFWDINSMKKTMEIRYEQEEEPFSVLCKPTFKEPYFYLANTKSQINGNGCLTAVSELNLSIIEVCFEIFIEKIQKKAGNRKNECKIDAQACGVIKEYVVVSAICAVFLYSREDFVLVDEFILGNEKKIVVFVI